MRSPSQHPSRLGGRGGLELDLGDRAPKRAAPARPAGTPLSASRPSLAAKAAMTDAQAARPISSPASDSDEPPSSGRGFGSGAGPARRPKASSLPPAPEGKASPFASSPGVSKSTPAPVSGPTSVGPKSGARPSNRPGSGDDGWGDEWADDPLDVGLDLGEDAPPASSDVQKTSRAPAATGSKPAVAAAPRPKVVVGGPAGAAAAAAAAAAEAPQAPPPTDYAEVEALAAYGPGPANIFLAPLYSYKVLRRRRELRELHALQARSHELARRAVREKQAEIVDKLAAAAPDALAAALAPIEDARRAIAERKAAMEANSGQVTERFLAIERELEVEQKNKKQLQRDRDMAQIKLEDAVHKRALVAAELKRVNALIENVHDAARRAAPGSDVAPPQFAQEIVELDAQKAKLVEQLRGRERAVAEARAGLREREGAISVLDQRVHGVHGRQAVLEKQGSEAENAARAALKLLEERRLVAYEEALAALSRDAPQLFDTVTRAQVEELARTGAQGDRELEKHRQAIDAFDKSAYQRGVAMAIGAAAVVLFVLILIARVK
jgi:hypothetical protein